MARLGRLLLIGIVVFISLGLPVGAASVEAAPTPVTLQAVCVRVAVSTLRFANNGPCAYYETRVLVSSDTPILTCRLPLNNFPFYITAASQCNPPGVVLTIPNPNQPIYLCATANQFGALRIVDRPGQCDRPDTLVVAQPPVSLTLSTITATPTTRVADGTSTATITVQLKNNSGTNLSVSAGTVTLSTTLGTLGPVTDNNNGTYTATLTAPTTTGTATISGTLNGAAFTQTATVTFTPGPPVAGQSTLTANPTSIPVGNANSSAITVRAKDQFGNNVPSGGATVVLNTTAGSLSGVTDNNNGTYSATLTAPNTTSVATISGTLNGGALGNTATVTFVPGPAVGANSTLFAQPSTLIANGTATSAITVQLKDAFNNNLTSGGATVVINTTAGSLSGVTDNNNGTYGATLTAPTAIGSATVSGTVNGVALGNTRNVDFVPGPPTAGQTTITVSPTSIQVSISPTSSTATITVQARDQFGNNLVQGGATVLLNTTAGSLGSVTDNGNGTYTATLTAPALVGVATITGTLNGNAITDDATVTFTAGPPANIAKHAGDGQSATVNTAVTIAPAVRITDANGNPLAGVSVLFAVATGGGSATGLTQSTDSNGVATVGSWTLGTTAGANTLTATAGALSVTFNATGTPGPATTGQTTITANPTQVTANGIATSTITVQLQDQYGNNLTASGGVVALSTTLGSLSAVTDNNNGTYTATISSATTGTATITGTLGGNAIADNATVDFVLIPTKYLVTAGAATVAAGGTVTITAQLADASDNPVPTAGKVVTWSKTGTGGSFATPTSTTNASGIATVVFTVGTVAGTVYTVTGTDGGGLTGTSGNIAVVAGPVDLTTSTITASPTAIPVSITPGSSTSTITVQMKDQYGNNRTTSGGTVVLSGGTLGPVTDNTNGSYTATLTAPATVGSATISGTLGGNAITDTELVTFTPGPLHHFLVELAAGGTIPTQTAGTPFAIKITAQDANNNTVTSFVSTVNITSNGTLSAGSGTTAAFAGGVLASHSVNFSAGGTGITITATRTGGSESGTSNAFTVQSPPTAVNDGPANNTTVPGNAYHIALNGTYNPAAPGILGNDTLGAPVATLTSFGGGSLGGTVTSNAAGATVTFGTGGSLTVNANGSLSFTPATNFTGTFTFQYRLTNSGGTSDATVTIAVGVRPSAVADNYNTATGGTLIGNVTLDTTTGTPYSVLGNDSGDQLTVNFVAASATNGAVTLNANGTFVFIPNAGFKSGNATFQYTLTNGFGTSAAVTVTLPVGADVIWFINNNAGACSSSCDGRQANPFQTLAAFVAVNNGTGTNPANGHSIFIFESATNYTGPVTLRNNQRLIGQDATSTLATLAGVTLPSHSTLPAMNTSGNTTQITNGSGNGVTTASNAGSTNHLYGLTLGNASGVALNGATFGTLRVADVIINTTGQALSLTTGTLAGNGFTSVTSSGGTNNLLLSAVATTGGTFAFRTGALSGATGDAFKIDGLDGAFSYTGTVTNSATLAVNIANKTGGSVTLSGDINPAGANKGISIASNSGTTAITFSGNNKKISTGTGTGVTLTNNTGATISFTGGGLAITTTSGIGLNATGGGTVNISTGSNANTISSTTGTAVNLNGGGGTMSLTSVSTNSASTAIDLTSFNGTFTVNGDGTGRANGSGGSITNATSHAINLTTVSGTITLKSLNITLNTSAIYGMLVNNDAGGVLTVNVTGITFTGVTTSVTQNKALLQFEAGLNGTNVTANVQNSFFNGSRTYGFFTRADNSAVMNVTLNQSGFGTDVNTGAPVNKPGSTITNPPAFGMTIGGQSSGSNVSFTVSNNTFWGADANNGALYAIGASGFTSGTLTGTFSGNQIGKLGVVGSGCAGNCGGIGLLPGTSGTYNVTVTNNAISNTGAVGINFANTVTGASGTSIIHITNNTLAEPNTGFTTFLRAIVVASGNSGGSTANWCAEVTGNPISGPWQAGNWVRVTTNNTTGILTLPGLTPTTGATVAQVNAFVQGNNTFTGGTGSDVNTSIGGAINGGAACTPSGSFRVGQYASNGAGGSTPGLANGNIANSGNGFSPSAQASTTVVRSAGAGTWAAMRAVDWFAADDYLSWRREDADRLG